jgi:predicted SnoaL-like aldol condensation-catalyzing enzyme
VKAIFLINTLQYREFLIKLKGFLSYNQKKIFMKKIIFAAFASVLCMCISCNTDTKATVDTKDNLQEQKNTAAANVVTKAFQTGDVSGVDSVVADDFVDHTDRGDVKGKDSLKSYITTMHSTFKDMKIETLNSAANGDYVYDYTRYTGTSDGSMGMPKGPYDMTAIELVKFRDGKAVEHWGFMQVQDMMKMMAPQPGMNNMGKTDTSRTKK